MDSKVCEYPLCNNKHDGSYGSGKFCSEKCSRAFASFNKRDDINKRVSEKLKGKKVGGSFKEGFDKNRIVITSEISKKINQKRKTK